MDGLGLPFGLVCFGLVRDSMACESVHRHSTQSTFSLRFLFDFPDFSRFFSNIFRSYISQREIIIWFGSTLDGTQMEFYECTYAREALENFRDCSRWFPAISEYNTEYFS